MYEASLQNWIISILGVLVIIIATLFSLKSKILKKYKILIIIAAFLLSIL